MEINKHLTDELKKYIVTNTHMADNLFKICNSYYANPVHNLQDMKNRSNKVKGDIFEYFCKLYLIHCYGLKTVWLLNEIPDKTRKLLNLNKRDYGIDLVAMDEEGKYYAIQAKFRKKQLKKTCVTWRQLSTFYALCARTGPYEKYIVFTTADYVKRIGKKSNKDITIGFNKLSKITHFQWLKMTGESINKLEKTLSNKLSNEELRKKRLLFFEKIAKV